jgi:hypothetical protein
MAPLKFGIAVRDISPRYPVWAHGYSARTRKSSGVREPLSLGCLAVTNGETRALIFTLDMIGVRSDVCDELYALLEKETGVGYPNILISGSHTHFAPALHGTAFTDPAVAFIDRDETYVDGVKARFVEAAAEALSSARPMRLETTRIQVPQVVYNRRTVRKTDGMVEMNLMYPEDPSPYTFSPVDSELTVHRLVDEAQVHGVLLNFGCHPVTGCWPDEDNYKFSADYPYYARQTISEKWHCPVLFTLGAAGDAVPINRRDDCRERIGSVLGNATILAERTFQADPSTDLFADVVEVETDTILEIDPSRAEVEYEAARKAVLAAEDTKSEGYRDLRKAFGEKIRDCGRARAYPENKWRIKVQFVRIGKTTLVSLPFEVLAEISLKMKERFPDSVLVSCSGGYQGYLPLAHEYDRVGYEATESSTHFVPGTADRVLEAILARLGK